MDKNKLKKLIEPVEQDLTIFDRRLAECLKGETR